MEEGQDCDEDGCVDDDHSFVIFKGCMDEGLSDLLISPL